MVTAKAKEVVNRHLASVTDRTVHDYMLGRLADKQVWIEDKEENKNGTWPWTVHLYNWQREHWLCS